MRPTVDFGSERERANLRGLVRQRGPDTGTHLDHLKLRSAYGQAAELANLAAQDPGYLTGGVTLTRREADTTEVLFMVDVSAVDGTDVLE